MTYTNIGMGMKLDLEKQAEPVPVKITVVDQPEQDSAIMHYVKELLDMVYANFEEKDLDELLKIINQKHNTSFTHADIRKALKNRF